MIVIAAFVVSVTEREMKSRENMLFYESVMHLRLFIFV